MYKGSGTILYVLVGSDYVPVACLTSNDFSESVEMLDSTTRVNNGWKTSRPNLQSFSVSFSGITINTRFAGGDMTKYSIDRLKVVKRTRQLLTWRIVTDNNVFIEDFQGYITDLQENAPVDDFLSFSGTIQGYGEPTSSGGVSPVTGAFEYTFASQLH